MSKEQIHILLRDIENGDYLDISKLQLRKTQKDLYFIDRRIRDFHLSIHKDGKVFLSPQSKSEDKNSKLLFEIDWNLVDEAPDSEKPFLFHVPANLQDYPIVNKNKRKGLRVVMENKRTITPIIKYFMISEHFKLLESSDKDLFFRLKRIDTEYSDGSLFSEELDANPEILYYNQHIIRYDINGVEFKDMSTLQFSYVFICQPNRKINILDFISGNKFIIDDKLIKREGYQIINFGEKHKEVVMIIFK